MSATIHNPTLIAALVLQPGSVFTRTRAGFDTGSRKYRCLSAVVEDLLPLRGDPDDQFGNMKVDTIVTTLDRNGMATVDVSYLGQLSASDSDEKPGEFTYTVNYEPNGARFTTTINGVSTTVDTSVFHPQVTHVYVSDSIPSTKVGQYIEPLKFADLIPEDVIEVPELGQTWTYNVAYKGWKLVNRTIRENVDKYEISDTYAYDFQFSSVTIT